MNQPPSQALSLDAREMASMPPATAFLMAEHLASLGRLDEALGVALSIRFESRLADPNDPDSERLCPYRLKDGLRSAAKLAALCAPDGIDRLLDAMEARAVPGEAPPRVDGSDVLAAVFSARPSAALALAKRAPAWVDLHSAGPSNAYLSPSSGLGLALSGAFGADLLDAYLERGQFALRLAKLAPDAAKNPAWEAAGSRLHEHLHRFCPRADPAAARPLLALVAKVAGPSATLLGERVRAASARGPLPASPLPRGWASAIAFGSHDQARDLLEGLWGASTLLSIAEAESLSTGHAARVFARGNRGAIERALLAAGPAAALGEHERKLAPSAVAQMVDSMPAHDFAAILARVAELGGRDALLQNCAHRFWILREQSSRATLRKMGDALAYCAAEGKIDHARALIGMLPELDRKDSADALAYMRKRESTHNGSSSAAWESLLLREAASEPLEAAPAPRPRRL